MASAQGAALQDIQAIVARRAPRSILQLSPARVTGVAAAAEISDALRLLWQEHSPDVVILARGGGATEDLDAFNSEEVARAIATCPVPVVSAVGHQPDHTLADEVADLRCATPSEAAERVTAEEGHRDESGKQVHVHIHGAAVLVQIDASAIGLERGA